MRRRTLGGWIVFFVKLVLIAALATTGSALLFTLANFSDHESKLIFAVKSNDAEMTKKELISLHYFYDMSRKWHVQKWADKYLFKDSHFYEVADAYLINDWKKVQDELKTDLDDPKAYPYGNAKFREKKAQFQKGAVSLEEALGFVMKEVSSDYEKTLRNCLDSGTLYIQCFDRVWNYDLATNKKDAEEALKGPKPQVKFILGPPKDKKEGKIPDMKPGKLPGPGKEGEERPGSGGPRKRP
jgi:hypothetical protein